MRRDTDSRLFLASGMHDPTLNVLCGLKGVEKLPPEFSPSLLVSYHYIIHRPAAKRTGTIADAWKTLNMANVAHRDWSLDSGAFTAWTMKKPIDLDSYIRFAKFAMDNDPSLVQIFSLDVIGDWKATLRNTEKMWRAGIPAVPTYHVGEPEHVLKSLAETYPKIALGGAVGMKQKYDWAQQCFARVWPTPMHGLGFGSVDGIMDLPWHSVDATNWSAGPLQFGTWRTPSPSGKRIKLNIRGSSHDLRTQVEFYLKIEERMNRKWRKELDALGLPQDCRRWEGF